MSYYCQFDNIYIPLSCPVLGLIEMFCHGIGLLDNVYIHFTYWSTVLTWSSIGLTRRMFGISEIDNIRVHILTEVRY